MLSSLSDFGPKASESGKYHILSWLLSRSFPLSKYSSIDGPSSNAKHLSSQIDENWLTMAQLNWLSLDLLLPGLRPTLLRAGITSTGPINSPGGTPPGGPSSARMTPHQVDTLIEDAQRELYNSSARISTRLHIVYATKKGS
jgi:hypothetical protein